MTARGIEPNHTVYNNHNIWVVRQTRTYIHIELGKENIDTKYNYNIHNGIDRMIHIYTGSSTEENPKFIAAYALYFN